MDVTKRSTNKKNGGFNFFLLMFIVVGIPFFTVKFCTSSSTKSVIEENTPINEVEYFDNETNESTYYSTEHSNDFYSSSNYQTSYTKDKNGLYKLTSPVMDTAHVFNQTQFTELVDYLMDLNNQTGVQIAVLTVDSMNGESIETFSMKYAEAWKLGQKGIDNGVLLTVAMAEHDVRIETGYGTEGTLTDAKCARILRNIIIPQFRIGNYSEGIREGVKNIAGVITQNDELITTDGSSNLNEDNQIESVIPVIMFGVIFFIGIAFIILSLIMSILFPHSKFVRALRNNSRRNIYGGHSTIHHNGGGFSGFSGGGGGFGGGGASGHW